MARNALAALLHFGALGSKLIVEEGSIGSAIARLIDLAQDLAGYGVWDGDGCDLALGGSAWRSFDA